MTINFIYAAVTASNLMPTAYTRAYRHTYENNLWDTYDSYFPLSTAYINAYVYNYLA
jgi:hypothetical protein